MPSGEVSKVVQQQQEQGLPVNEALGVGQVKAAALSLDEQQAAVVMNMVLKNHHLDRELETPCYGSNDVNPVDISPITDVEGIYRFAVERPELINDVEWTRHAFESVIGLANDGIAFTDLDRDKLIHDYVYQMKTRCPPADHVFVVIAEEWQEYWEEDKAKLAQSPSDG